MIAPDLVLLVGRTELYDRIDPNGRPTNINDPAYASYIRQQLQRVVTLTAGEFEPRAATIRGDELYLTNSMPQSENGAVLIVNGWRPTAPTATPDP